MPRGVVLPSARPLNRLLSAERINQIHVPSQEWSKNAMHGSGVLRSASGSIFEGEWFNNTCTGYGASLSTNGETYEVRCILQVSHNSSCRLLNLLELCRANSTNIFGTAWGSCKCRYSIRTPASLKTVLATATEHSRTSPERRRHANARLPGGTFALAQGALQTV